MKPPKPPLISIIVPTLNEEKYIRLLITSIKQQRSANFEILIVDGGSRDKTLEIAKKDGAKVFKFPGYGEFISRNIGAKEAEGKYLLFTCADIMFPEDLLQKITEEFRKNPMLIALTGPGHPYDAPVFGKVEYVIYNAVRFILAKMPKPLKRFSTSTNFLVVRKDYFEKTGGFAVNDINADGLMGRTLLNMGEVKFSWRTCFYLSARRMKKMGFWNFNKHYLYAFENIFFGLSNTPLLNAIKGLSKRKHGKMHEAT
ncbi:glycosyltransferase [Candidatus Bathyarchaeota archaeon]|nr:glycosyltransferase [Candidatus Bathyarchaeota archaeon]